MSFPNSHTGLRRLVLLVATLAAAMSPVRQMAAEPGERISEHLLAGEFGPALQLANRLSDRAQHDTWLGRIAAAQARSGARVASLGTAYDIQNDRMRSDTMDRIANQPLFGGAARGGAALADFDTLIELITSTIAPDTWDDVGGPGAIEPFPTGVYVDSSGVMKRVSTDSASTLAAVRRSAAASSGNRDVRKTSGLRKVSLTRLERHLQMMWALGKEADEAMRTLAGLQQVKYVLFYPETRDIVVAGPAGDWTTNLEGRLVSAANGRPVLRLDELVVVLRNAMSGDGRFGCAITPEKENLASVQAYLRDSSTKPLRPSQREAWLDELRERLGMQQISVFGIDPRTRAARVLVEADYHMKLVGMGLEEGTLGVTSYLDSIEVPAGGSPPPMDVLRWWFSMNYEAVRTTRGRDAYELRGPGVKVLSENEFLTERGDRVHTGKSDELNHSFAHSFTTHYQALAAKYPIYAELRNVFDLALVAAIIRAEDLSGQVHWELTHFGDPEKYRVQLDAAPRFVESVINHRVINRQHIVVGVSGGVAVDTSQFVRTTGFNADNYGLLESSRISSSPRDVPRDAWWWD